MGGVINIRNWGSDDERAGVSADERAAVGAGSRFGANI